MWAVAIDSDVILLHLQQQHLDPSMIEVVSLRQRDSGAHLTFSKTI